MAWVAFSVLPGLRGTSECVLNEPLSSEQKLCPRLLMKEQQSWTSQFKQGLDVWDQATVVTVLWNWLD